MTPRAPSRPSLEAPAAVAGGALLLGLGEALQAYVRARAFDLPLGWRPLAEPLATWAILALLTPIPFAAGRRLRLERGRLPRRLAGHAAAGLAFAGLGVAAVAAFLASTRPDLSVAFMAGKVGTAYGVYYLAVYAAIVGAVHAAHYHRLSRERAEQLVRERLEGLRRQLNPHFLFNTLNAVSTLALERDHERVVRCLGQVGDLLRATLDDATPQQVPLERELELAGKYLAIQEVRFGDRLRVELGIDPAARDALVPTMVLQPLLENAVDHAVAAVPGACRVTVEARADAGRLRLAVTDSGPGFRGARREGIGLANTRERLRALYGDAQSLTTGDVAGGGARIEIVLPLNREGR